MVQRFVDASILGWYRYLYGENVDAANALIERANPAMTDMQIEYSRRKMREWGLVDSGDAAEQGIGAIDPERVAAFCKSMVAAGMYEEGDFDSRQAVSLQFVNKGAGRELAPAAAPRSRPR
jgi:NitT/TauT family transport system substrate-binding protein